MENVNEKYVWGMDGQIYVLGPPILNGRLLIHATRKTRLFVTESEKNGSYIYWKQGKEYPEEVIFYDVGSAVLNDIELDLCPRLKHCAVVIDKEKYDFLREGKK